MAMTPREMFDFFGEQADSWWDARKAQMPKRQVPVAPTHLWVNVVLAFFGKKADAVDARKEVAVEVAPRAMNVDQAFKCGLMQGLIAWRLGDNPVQPLTLAVQRLGEGIKEIASLGCLDDSIVQGHLPFSQVGIVCFLIDAPPPSFHPSNLRAEMLLDHVLASGLQDKWDEETLSEGLRHVRKFQKRSALAVETYQTYARLLHASPREVGELVAQATRLFLKRAHNGYYDGAEGTEGGGPDNAVTVDYRLAAIMKKIGWTGENMHRWRW